jgi:hypothetical protein
MIRWTGLFWAVGVAAAVVVVGAASAFATVHELFLFEASSARSQTASPALSARSTIPDGAASSMIAFISEPDSGGYCALSTS